MINLLVLILAFAIASGQLIRVPIGSQGGITILDMTVFLFCLWGVVKTKFKLQKPPPGISASAILIFTMILSLILTPLHLKTEEYMISFLYTVRFFLYVLFAWLVFSNAFGDFKKNLDKVFLLSGIAIAILGLEQFIFFPNLDFLNILGWDPHYFRTVSTFLDPNFAGAFLVLTLLLLAVSYLRSDRIPGVFYALFTIVYLTLLTTFSRSSYLMFLVSGLTFSLLKQSKTYITVTLALFVGLLLGFQVYTRLVSGPRHIDRTESASFRLNTWQQGFILFQKFPILGVGFNAYQYGLKEYNLGDEQFLASHGSSSNDSSLLFVAATTGVIGLFSFLYFIFSLIRINYKLPVLPAILGLLVHSIFANSLFYPPILIWILLIGIIPKK